VQREPRKKVRGSGRGARPRPRRHAGPPKDLPRQNSASPGQLAGLDTEARTAHAREGRIRPIMLVHIGKLGSERRDGAIARPAATRSIEFVGHARARAWAQSPNMPARLAGRKQQRGDRVGASEFSV